MLTVGTIKARVGYCLINQYRYKLTLNVQYTRCRRMVDCQPFHIHSVPSAAPISSSLLPIPTAISTRALEMASLLPSYISSGVIGIPSFWAMVVTLSTLGLEVKPVVNLFKLACAFIRPWSWEAGSLESCISKAFCCCSLLASASATPSSS